MEQEGSTYEDGYDNILGFPQWFGHAKNMDSLLTDYPENYKKNGQEENQKILNNGSAQYSTYWRNDPITDFMIPETFQKYTIYYFDENSVQYNVEVME